MSIKINIKDFYEQFKKEYNFLYDNYDNVVGYDEALKDGDDFIANHKNFVSEFVKYRGDFISSDREVVAFMFALYELMGFTWLGHE